MKPVPASLALLLSAFSLPALAIDGSCADFIAATEKSAQQPARHAITALGEGSNAELITVAGKSYIKADKGWRALPVDLLAAERKVNAQMRSGAIPVFACKSLGDVSIDGVATTTIRYTVTMPGAEPATANALIGKDGLVYGIDGSGTRVRYRYKNVTAPAL